MRGAIGIEGGGVAALCCARLLQVSATEPKSGGPVLLINDATQLLLRDIFSTPDLLTGLHPIRRRKVAWGRSIEPVELPHRAVSASQEVLLERLRAPLRPTPAVHDPDWIIRCSRKSDPSLEQKAFGHRVARVYRVQLTDAAESSCSIESVERGWLFLIALGRGEGSLITVGGTAQEFLTETRLMNNSIAGVAAALGEFDSHPRISEQLCGSGWVACGSAAMAFDPLCGEGAGNAAREAILASAVVQAAVEGLNTEALLHHYATRLQSGFLRHLQVCREFYSSGFGGSWWDEQVASLDDGIAWMRSRISPESPRFRLNGFRLEPIAKLVPNPHVRARPAIAGQPKP